MDNCIVFNVLQVKYNFMKGCFQFEFCLTYNPNLFLFRMVDVRRRSDHWHQAKKTSTEIEETCKTRLEMSNALLHTRMKVGDPRNPTGELRAVRAFPDGQCGRNSTDLE